MHDVLEGYLEAVSKEFRTLKRQADKALAQVDDAAFFARLDEESNSMAVIVKHVAGNLRSRWTDFLTTDGEKPERHRDREFIIEDGDTRATLTAAWDEGWKILTESVAALTLSDLDKSVTIRNEPHSVVLALQRALTHTAGHVGQLVLLAKHCSGPNWRTVSIPKGQSDAFNVKMKERHVRVVGDR
jgi:Protein of unknown function (DUF1572)